MKLLLDTHFVLWIVLGVPRLDEFPWLERYRPWGVSPISLLEVKFLAEVGRLEVRHEAFVEAIGADRRFVVDDPPFLTLVRHALTLEWTRDPFDRFLAAHSEARRTPLCTLDKTIRERHALLPAELRG